MAGKWKEVARVSFQGERFRDRALDLSALGELQQFQKIIAETAKSLWKKGHPDRERLPKHFEDRARLCLREILPGSTVAPLEVYLEDDAYDQTELGDNYPAVPEEVSTAVALSYEVYESVRADCPLPSELPKDLIPEFAKWGAGLAADEHIEFFVPGREKATCVSVRERERLAHFADRPYSDEVDVLGEVLEADVRQRRFHLWLDEKSSVQVNFDQSQEAQVTTALRDHESVRRRVRGRGEFEPEGTIRRVTEVASLALVQEGEPVYDESARPIEEILQELAREVPQEEWDSLPADFTDRLDYHLYGGGEG